MAAQEQTKSVLDPKALNNLKEMVGGDDDFLAELVDTFLTQAPQLLADIRQAIANGDAAGLRLAAHSLKSNSAEFGAMTLSELCRELEFMGKADTLEGAADLTDRVEAEYVQASMALEAICK